MKFKFTSKSKALAEKFKQHLKADRNIEASISDKDGKFYVEYSVAEVDMAAMKAKKKAKSAKKPAADKAMPDKSMCSKADMGGMNPQDCEDDDEYVEMDDLQEMFSSFAQYIFQEMQYQMNWMWSEIDYIENTFYQHVQNGHLPPINGADKMSNALKVLGIAGDYDVQKPVIYASTSNSKVPSLELDFPEPKKK